MPWIKKKKHHVCRTPQRGGAGSEWQCRKCKKKWRLVSRVTHPNGYSVIFTWDTFR